MYDELSQFEVRYSEDGAKFDAELWHEPCEQLVCDLEQGDTFDVLARTAATHECNLQEIRASELRIGATYREIGLDGWRLIGVLGRHGDTVLVTTEDSTEHSHDIDEVVERRGDES